MSETQSVKNISPKIGPMDHRYLAGLHDRRVAIYAPTIYAAKQKAVEHFRPKKKDMGLLWVELAD